LLPCVGVVGMQGRTACHDSILVGLAGLSRLILCCNILLSA